MAIDRRGELSRDETDETLVRRILGGPSEPAFRLLYRRHSPRLFRIALRLLSSEADAEDVLQEAWLRAVPRLGAFEWRSALGTWLASIVINLSRDVLDRRGRWVMAELDVETPTHAPADVLDSMDLERALTELPAGSRAVFVLHDVEGFTHEEIAVQLGCTAGTSKSQLFRARRALRRLLGDATIEEKRYAR